MSDVEAFTGDGCLESLTGIEKIQIAEMALAADFVDRDPILDPQVSCEGIDLVRRVINSLKEDPSKILDMPILPKSEIDPKCMEWIESIGLTDSQLQQNLSWSMIKQAFEMSPVMNALLSDYFYSTFPYSYCNGSWKISLRKFLEIVRIAVCGEVYAHNVLRRVKSYMHKYMLDDVNPIKTEVSIIFYPQLKYQDVLGAYLGNLEGRHIIVFRHAELNVWANPYFDYDRVLEEDAITVAHELAHASHAEVLGVSKLVPNSEDSDSEDSDSEDSEEILIRRKVPYFINSYHHSDKDYIYWFSFVEGYATYVQLKYINEQVKRSFGEERDRWLSLREKFFRELRSREYDVTEHDTDTNSLRKLYVAGILLIHRIHKRCYPIPLSSIISLYAPHQFYRIRS